MEPTQDGDIASKTQVQPSDVVGYFQQHLVPICFIFEKDGQRLQPMLMSAFVLEVSNYWFLITAGHCLEDVEKLQRAGYSIAECTLIDSLGPLAKHNNVIPFPYDQAEVFSIDQGGVDYGAVYLPDLYCSLLKANGICSLNEQTWKHVPEDIEFYRLLGVPGQLTTYHGDVAHIATTLHALQPAPDKRFLFEEVTVEMFVARIQLGDTLSNIRGLSGGPIFAFRSTSTGMRYWLHSIQSRWIRSERLIGACYAQPLAERLEEALHEARTQLESEGDTVSDENGE